jgi:phosphate acetyltransferase
MAATGPDRRMTDTDPTAKGPSKHDRLITAAQAGVAPVTLLVHRCDEQSLRGAVEAGQARLILPVLVGPQAKLRKLAAAHDIDLTGRLSIPPTATRRPKRLWR